MHKQAADTPFLYANQYLEGMIHPWQPQFEGPANIGSEEMITINGHMVIEMSRTEIEIENIASPLSVSGRNSDNPLVKESLD